MAKKKTTSHPLVYLIAGEVSGDLIGGRIMAALKRRTKGAVRFAGIGGEHMAAEGLDSLFPMEDLTVLGLAEIVPHLPRLWRRLRWTAKDIRARRPAVVLCIDLGGFNRAVGWRLSGSGIPLVQFKAVQAWAYLPRRARSLARYFDRVLCILPFEPEFFEREFGLKTTFIGYPALESGADAGDGPGFRKRHGLDPVAPLVCLLPGSRGSEIGWSLPLLEEAAQSLRAERPDLQFVVPTVEPVAGRVIDAVKDWPVPVLPVSGGQERYDAFAASTAAVAVSGTVTTELAIAGVPAVVVYRLGALTAWFGRRIVKVGYASIVNLVLDRPVFPEYLQENCTAANAAAAVLTLLNDEDARARQTEGLREAVAKLDAGAPSTERAAEVIESYIKAV